MSEFLSEVLKDSDHTATRRGPANDHPTGWNPGVEFDGKTLTVTSSDDGADIDPAWDDKFAERGLDPADYVHDGPINFRFWDTNIGDGETKELRYFRATFKPRPETHMAEEDLDALVAHVLESRPALRAVKTISGPEAMVVGIADWQLGKGDPAELTDRILDGIGQVAETVVRASPQQIILASTGDIVESCANFYPNQPFNVTLDRRDQLKLSRSLLLKAVTTLAPLTESLTVLAAGGNHGENREDGKSRTTFADNDDLALWEVVREVIEQTPLFDRVKFVIPTGESLDSTYAVGDAVIGVTHGHQGGRGTTPQKKLWDWWSGQTMGRQPIGDADILLSGHYHHMVVNNPTKGRTHIQFPTLEMHSHWFRMSTGMQAEPGIATFTIDGGRWNNLRIHHA